MNSFPDFIKDEANRIPEDQQNTAAVEGFVYQGRGAGQVAFWTCHEARESNWHRHDFPEYLCVVAGEYVLVLEEGERTLGPGDEVEIRAGARQSARIAAGTRTIHAFGGRRIAIDPDE